MNFKHINTLAIFLLLLSGAVSSACTTGKIEAQTPANTKPAVTAKTPETAKTTYQQPKRISKDILK
jgi:hypothetical protein